MSVTEIIQQSSNVGTIKIGLKLGGEKLDEYVHRFGFGERTGIGFPGESEGMVLPREDWSGSTIATIPIGQGIAVTPLQMISAFATIANDGVRVEPKLLYGTMGPDGKMDRVSPPAVKRVVSCRTAHQMQSILSGVTTIGTGLLGSVPGFRVAGKTGTAQKPLPTGGYGNSYVASFGGFAPAGDPRIVGLVILDDPSPIWGGMTAAPTFSSIMQFALRHLGVPPTGDAEAAAQALEEAQAEATTTHD
jgi:cell division protein FtsI (penicillin-binding protein 3)